LTVDRKPIPQSDWVEGAFLCAEPNKPCGFRLVSCDYRAISTSTSSSAE
jgi:hypothetical protein